MINKQWRWNMFYLQVRKTAPSFLPSAPSLPLLQPRSVDSADTPGSGSPPNGAIRLSISHFCRNLDALLTTKRRFTFPLGRSFALRGKRCVYVLCSHTQAMDGWFVWFTEYKTSCQGRARWRPKWMCHVDRGFKRALERILTGVRSSDETQNYATTPLWTHNLLCQLHQRCTLLL